MGRLLLSENQLSICQACGFKHSQTVPQCEGCSRWDTVSSPMSNVIPFAFPMRNQTRPQAISIMDDEEDEDLDNQKFSTGTPAFDRVLGGGIVPGSKSIVSGDASIGKSTLLLRLCANMAGKGDRIVLYATAEETKKQIRDRAKRMDAREENLKLLATKEFSDIERAVREMRPDILILDSISTMISAPDESSGSVAELKRLGDRIVELVEHSSNQLAVFIVSHVTKTNAIAGPKSLQHLFDATFYLEEAGDLRRLRALKNRYGKETSALFEMTERGMEAVENPSKKFLSDRVPGLPGSVVGSICDGSRIAQTTLFEVQALVSAPKPPGRTGAIPNKLASNGIHKERLSQIIDVLDISLKAAFPEPYKLKCRDVRANIVGGLTAHEPAVDLPIAIAIASNMMQIPINPHLVVFGEIGLAGEIRSVPRMEPRVQESIDMGFKSAIVPRGSASYSTKRFSILEVTTLTEALQTALAPSSSKPKKKRGV